MAPSRSVIRRRKKLNGKKRKELKPVRERLFKEQNGKCIWCKVDMLPAGTMLTTRVVHPLSASLDHIVPMVRANGDPRDRSNLAVACVKCNTTRHKGEPDA